MEKEKSRERTVELEEELRRLREERAEEAMRAETRDREAEAMTRLLSEAHEERVASLETKLAVLSSTIAQYHSSRISHQAAINTLKVLF